MLPLTQSISSTCPNSGTTLFFPKKGTSLFFFFFFLKALKAHLPTLSFSLSLSFVSTCSPFTSIPGHDSPSHWLLLSSFPTPPYPRTHQSRASFSLLLPRVSSRPITVLDALLDTCFISHVSTPPLSLPHSPLYHPLFLLSLPPSYFLILMERRGGCCIVRYGGEPDVAWKMDRIMLKFRPIAPKPTVDGGAAAAPAAAPPKTGRKRRGNTTSTNPTSAGRGRKVIKKEDNFNLKTLALMPETPERKEEVMMAVEKKMVTYVPAVWALGMGTGTGEVVVPRPVRPAGSWVTVECVTDTWREVSGWGCEEEARRRAVLDTCPVFLSGALDRVTWTNEAYRRMVVGEEEEEEEEEEVRVALVTRGMVPSESVSFTCRVRVRYACRKGKGSLAAPCDVWRLGDGVLAWRLDVKAALSLSLGR